MHLTNYKIPLTALITSLIWASITYKIDAQLNDLTPPGVWKDLSATSIKSEELSQDILQIEATDLDGNEFYFLYKDEKLLSIFPDSNIINLKFRASINDTSLYEITYASDSVEVISLYGKEINILQRDRSWSDLILYKMTDGSNRGFAKYNDRYFPIIVNSKEIITTGHRSYENVTIFTSNSKESRHYFGVFDEGLGQYIISYHDVFDGFNESPIIASFLTFIDSPSDTTHVLINNNSPFSSLFKYSGGTFQQITIPGGPYTEIKLLYRDAPTSITLFQVRDASNNIRIVKRKSNNWTDITSSFPSLLDVNPLVQSGDEGFLIVKVNSEDIRLWYFQSTESGELLADITPAEGPFNQLTQQYRELTFPLTFNMQDTSEHDWMYQYYTGSNLIAPPHVIINPEGTSVPYAGEFEGLFEFDYYNHDSSQTYRYLYEQPTPGSALQLLTQSQEVSANNICRSNDYIIIEETHLDGSEHYWYYDFNTMTELSLPSYDQDSDHDLDKYNSGLCFLENYINDSLWGYSVIERKLVDIAYPHFHPPFYFEGFEKQIVVTALSKAEPQLARLFGISTLTREASNCNTDIKLFYDETTDIFTGVNEINAEELYIRTGIPNGANPHFTLNAEESVEFLPGFSIEESANVSIEIKECPE